MWWWRGGRDHTQGRPGRAWSDGGGGGEGCRGWQHAIPLRDGSYPVSTQHTNTWAKGNPELNALHGVSSRMTMYDRRSVPQRDSSCLSFTPDTCRQTRPCVDMSPPSPPRQILRLTLQQFVWKSALAGCQGLVLLPPYWESVSSESPRDRLPTTAAFLLPRINVPLISWPVRDCESQISRLISGMDFRSLDIVLI